MNENISSEEREYSNRIYSLRFTGQIADAVTVCEEAIQKFPSSNFFYKIKGDLLFEQGNFDAALQSYLTFLDKINKKPEYFTNFAKFFRKLNQKQAISEAVFNQLASMICTDRYSYILQKNITNLLLDTYPVSDTLSAAVTRAIHGGNHTFPRIKDDYEQIRKAGKCGEIIYLCKVSLKQCSQRVNSIDRYFLKRLENNKLFEQAISFTQKILGYSSDGVVVRTLFRLCRECSDYSAAEAYLHQHNIETKNEFNIQYELVLYFDSIGDEQKRNAALARIDILSEDKIPICRTLFKFYVKFNLLDKAQAIQEKIMGFNQKAASSRRLKKETENIVWDRLRTLVDEQEHTRQLLAISELIKGFAHELGQPITNIRYAIQLFYMKNRKRNIEIIPEEKQLLDSILTQTERVGKLLNRFSPIISSKSEKKYFNVYQAVNNIFDELSVRLNNEKIEYFLRGNHNTEIYGEELQFGQVFYNLIINSIYAIKRTDRPGKIEVSIEESNNTLKISFSDNGTGISPELQRKIFEPFFSTKNKETEEGGEGLGLFIVWNILKIFSGKISVDATHQNGAKFIIIINLEENRHV